MSATSRTVIVRGAPNGDNMRTCHYVGFLLGAGVPGVVATGKSDLPPNSERWPYGEGCAGVARDKDNM